VQTGRVKNPGVVVLRNTFDANWERMPTDEERAGADALVLEVRIQDSPPGAEDGGVLLVPPGECYTYLPGVGCRVFVRCRAGAVKFLAVTFPR
jgi:hypothetical protein